MGAYQAALCGDGVHLESAYFDDRARMGIGKSHNGINRWRAYRVYTQVQRADAVCRGIDMVHVEADTCYHGRLKLQTPLMYHSSVAHRRQTPPYTLMYGTGGWEAGLAAEQAWSRSTREDPKHLLHGSPSLPPTQKLNTRQSAR